MALKLTPAEYPALRRDRTALLWQLKRRIYERSRLTIVAPSRWLEAVARTSPLLRRCDRKRPKPSHQQGVAYLPILPRITLLIVGGGHVGQAVAKLGSEVDFDTTQYTPADELRRFEINAGNVSAVESLQS